MLHRSNLSIATIKAYLSAISHFNKRLNIVDFTKASPITLAIKGLESLRKPVFKRLPITFELLSKILTALRHINLSPYEVALYQAMFIMMYFCGLRASEVGLSASSEHALLTSNVIRVPDGYQITLHSYKFSKQPSTFLLRPRPHLDPVKILSSYASVRPASAEFFFCGPDTSLINRSKIARVLKNALIFINVDPRYYNTHSFRIGFATDMLNNNVSTSLIRVRGRWCSDTFMDYFRPPYVCV